MHMFKIFSYGTLRNSKFVRDREVVEATLEGPYAFKEEGFPLLHENARTNKLIKGLFFLVTEDEINEIDDYEGMPHLFKRQEKEIVLADGTKELAWVYLLNEY